MGSFPSIRVLSDVLCEVLKNPSLKNFSERTGAAACDDVPAMMREGPNCGPYVVDVEATDAVEAMK